MTAQAQAMTRRDLEAKIVQRYREDEGFRREFTADPAGAFGKYLGMPPAGMPKISVHEETLGTWHIVLPTKPDETSQLSDQDLERVAGGTTPLTATVSLVAVSVGYAVPLVSQAVVLETAVMASQAAAGAW
jgi:hypothetical protein